MDVARLSSLLALGARGVSALNTVEDMRRIARRRMPQMVFDFVDGGADGELGVEANRVALDGLRFAPTYLADVTDRDQSIEVFGSRVTSPFLLAPAGLATLAHPDGELAAARAAAEAGTVFCVSTASGYALEEIAEVAAGRLWFQLYIWKSDAVVESLVDRAKAAGYEAIVVTVDVPVVGKRERDLRNGMSLPVRVRPRSLVDAVFHLPWIWHMLNGPEITFASLAGLAPGDDASSIGEYVDRELTDQTRTWDDLRALRRDWSGPLIVKGVMTAADARAAVDAGADGVIVSNHGGRQLGSVAGTAAVLPAVVDAVGDRAEVFLDGGIRRGEDIVKARALGATAAMGGRAWFFALAAGGEAGVLRVLDILAADVDRTLALIGRSRFEDVDAGVLQTPSGIGGVTLDFSMRAEWEKLRVRSRRVAAEGVAEYGKWNDSWINGHSKDFSRVLAREGWIGMTWPEEFGGGGRHGIERIIMAEEMIAAGAPIAASWIADRQMGPAICSYGTPEQRAEFLPGILSGDTTWCIGMSEPDAGSDLASPSRPRAVRDGDAVRDQRPEDLDQLRCQVADYCYLIVSDDSSEGPTPQGHKRRSSCPMDLRRGSRYVPIVRT